MARRWDVGSGALGTDAVKGRPPLLGRAGWSEGIIARGGGGTVEVLVMDGRDSSATLGMT